MPWQIFRQRDFTGGESLATLPEAIADNQLIKAENVLVSPEGYLTNTFQTDTVGLTISSGTLNGIVFSEPDTNGRYNYWHTSVSDTDTIVAGSYDPAQTVNVSLGTAHAAITNNTAPLPKIEGMSYAIKFLGKYYCPNKNGGILNLSDYVRIYDGGLTNKTVVKLTAYFNRLWAVYSDGSLGYSDNGDATTWDALNIILLPNQEPAIDFIPVQGGAIVYSHSSIYAMYGTDYTDIQFIKLKDGVMLSEGAVEVDDTVYICSNRGMVAVALNGVRELPHTQNTFFKENYKAWAVQLPGVVQGIYLYKYKAIMYLIKSTYATQGFLYYIPTNAYYKLNMTLPVTIKAMLPLYNSTVDFLVYKDGSNIAKGVYPVGNLAATKTLTIQTKFQDFDSLQEKYWRTIYITVKEAVPSATIKAYLDDSSTGTTISTQSLIAGENVIQLHTLPRSKNISIEISSTATAGQSGKLTIQELGIKFREVGIRP